MVELIGSVAKVTPKDNGKVDITFEIDENQVSDCVKLRSFGPVSVRVFRYRPKRSGEANKYLWYLCNELAEALSSEHTKHTKEDVYKRLIHEFGVYDEEELDPKTAKVRRLEWELQGVGWVTEQVDYSEDGQNVIVRFYYGTSTYNTKQMSRLIDSLVQDCEAVGIETKTPAELDVIKKSWKKNSG